MARNTRIFSDIDLNFAPHPVTGDLALKYDEQAIKQSLQNLMLTKHYERPFNSELGSPIPSLLFEPDTPLTSLMLRRAIIELIGNWEPRINIIDVQIIPSPDNNSYYVELTFKIANTERPLSLDLILERTR